MKRLGSILVATDLADGSDNVMRAAAALAALTGAQLHVLHAFEFEGVPYAAPDRPPLTFQGHIKAAEQALDEQIARTVHGDVNVASRQVIVYIAFKAIRDRARAVNADLVVLARHRRRPTGDAFLGSTADRVIRSVDVPCLIVHEPLAAPLRRVLVPIDLSEPALGALEVALSWGASLAPASSPPELIVFYAIPRVFDFADVPLDHAVWGAEVTRAVAATRKRLPDETLMAVREEIRWADSPTDAILQFARDESADLIVMGTHGYGAFKRALIGSVASGVARAASCPVLLVPPALWKEETEPA